jgi:hypothetical protein
VEPEEAANVERVAVMERRYAGHGGERRSAEV